MRVIDVAQFEKTSASQIKFQLLVFADEAVTLPPQALSDVSTFRLSQDDGSEAHV